MPATIDPQKVPEICKRLGIKPRRGEYTSIYEETGACGCLVGIELAAIVGFLEAHTCRAPRKRLASETGLPEEFVSGLSMGWECGPCEDPRYNRETLDGIRIGNAAWQACVDAGLVPA